jgi:hypothetical protein
MAFVHIGVSTPREFSGNNAAASIVTWYLSRNRGDSISFIGDYDNERELPYEVSWDEIDTWPDRTDQVVEELIENGILKDCGRTFEDEDDPENVYIRDLRNCWSEDESGEQTHADGLR